MVRARVVRRFRTIRRSWLPAWKRRWDELAIDLGATAVVVILLAVACFIKAVVDSGFTVPLKDLWLGITIGLTGLAIFAYGFWLDRRQEAYRREQARNQIQTSDRDRA